MQEKKDGEKRIEYEYKVGRGNGTHNIGTRYSLPVGIAESPRGEESEIRVFVISLLYLITAYLSIVNRENQ